MKAQREFRAVPVVAAGHRGVSGRHCDAGGCQSLPGLLAGRPPHRVLGGCRPGGDRHAAVAGHPPRTHGDLGVGRVAVGLVRRSRHALTVGCTPAVDHQRQFGRDKVGVREYEGHLITVIAVDGGEDDPSGRHSPSATRRPRVPLQAVADGAAAVRCSPRQHRHRLGEGAPRGQRGRVVQARRLGSRGVGAGRRPARLVCAPHLAGAADEPAAQRRRGGGPRFAGLDAGGGHRAAGPRSRRTTAARPGR